MSIILEALEDKREKLMGHLGELEYTIHNHTNNVTNINRKITALEDMEKNAFVLSEQVKGWNLNVPMESGYGSGGTNDTTKISISLLTSIREHLNLERKKLKDAPERLKKLNIRVAELKADILEIEAEIKKLNKA